jgi:predicted naringenin-chalcone synthase
MNGHILGIATAVPKYTSTQENALKKNCELFSFDEKEREQVQKLYENSGIRSRYSVCEDFVKKPTESTFLGANYPQVVPGMSARNAIYKQEAPLLAHQAAEKAIKAWGGDPTTITHIISVSCTGVVIPGIEFSLLTSLNLKRTIYRLGINFMGCFGAFKGLEVANAFAKMNSQNRVLVVCTELCSLHIQADDSHDSLLANSIFADGAAAIIVGANPTKNESPLWEIVKHHSIGLEDSTELMRWEASDHGYVMKLSNFVPVALSRHLGSFTKELLGNITIAECDWPVHPGGKAILSTIEKKLGLNPSQTKASWNTLENYGNMSSATFPFVLENLLTQPQRQPWAVGLGFGPGLSIEGVLLKK